MSKTDDALWKQVAVHDDVSVLILFKPKSENPTANVQHLVQILNAMKYLFKLQRTLQSNRYHTE